MDQLTQNDFNNRVEGFKRNFKQEFNAIIENIESNKQSEIKASFTSKLEEKGKLLGRHGVHLLQTEINQAHNHNGLHADFKTDVANFFTKLQDKYRLNKAYLIYEQHISRALKTAKKQLKRKLLL